MPDAVGWRRAVVVFMSVFLMRPTWDLEIALNGVPAKIRPLGLLQPGRT